MDCVEASGCSGEAESCGASCLLSGSRIFCAESCCSHNIFLGLELSGGGQWPEALSVVIVRTPLLELGVCCTPRVESGVRRGTLWSVVGRICMCGKRARCREGS